MTWTRRAAMLGLSLAVASGCGRSNATAAGAARDSANTLLTAGDYDRAIQLFDRAIALDSTSAIAYRSRGLAYQRKEQHDRAIQDFDRAIRLKQDFATAFSSRAFSFQMKDEYEHAIESYDEALKLDPKLAIALKNRGRAHYYLGHFDRAAADLAEGLRYDSTNAFVTIWLHMATKRLGRDDASEFATHLARTDSTIWPAPVARMYQGRITPEQLVAAAAVPDGKTRREDRCYAFYTGEWMIWQGDTTGAARQLEAARTGCPRASSEYQGSVADLARIGPRPH